MKNPDIRINALLLLCYLFFVLCSVQQRMNFAVASSADGLIDTSRITCMVVKSGARTTCKLLLTNVNEIGTDRQAVG